MEKSESFALRCFHSVSCPAIFGVLPLAHSSLEEIGSGAAAAAREAKTAAFTTWRQGGRPGPARQGRNSETQHRSVDGPLPPRRSCSPSRLVTNTTRNPQPCSALSSQTRPLCSHPLQTLAPGPSAPTAAERTGARRLGCSNLWEDFHRRSESMT